MVTLVMDYTGEDGVVNLCSDGITVERYPIRNFFIGGEFIHKIKDTTVFVDDFQLLAMFFVRSFIEVGLHDTTREELTYTKNHKLDRDCFKYILSKDTKKFFSISYRYGSGDTVNLYDMSTFIASDMRDISRDFEDEPAIASWKAINTLRGYAPRAKTISSCAYSRWKSGYNHSLFDALFPDQPGDVEELCRLAYHGGLCLTKEGCSGKAYRNGITIDANSLYPFVMRTKKFPVGKPHYDKGDVPEYIKKSENTTYYIHFRASFELKKDHIPFVRTRCDKRHWQVEILKTSAYYDRDGKRYDLEPCEGVEYVDKWGEIYENAKPITVELCMYKPEFELFFEQYDVSYIEILDHVWYDVRGGIFSDYVDYFYQLKTHAKTKSEKRLAKMMLNALSGRMSLKVERENSYLCSNIEEVIDNYGSLDYYNKKSQRGKYTKMVEGVSSFIGGDEKTISQSRSHIQVGAAITSEAMVFMVRLIQKNYKHFIYTDTDSMHLDCGVEDLVGIKIGNNLGEFKVEEEWIYARYLQDKVYYMIRKNGGTCKVTWAGMPESCQEITEAIVYNNFWNNAYDDIDEINKLNDDMMQILGLLRERNKDIPDTHWKVLMNTYDTVRLGKGRERGEVYNIRIPYARRTVKSYKDYTFCTKIDNYKVDIFTE